MSYENGIISKTDPINVEEPYFVMGVAPLVDEDGDDLYDVGYAGSNNHGKMNQWSMYKPVEYDSEEEIPPLIRETLTGFYIELSTMGPFSIPLIKPKKIIEGWYRLCDWLGYNHYAKPFKSSIQKVDYVGAPPNTDCYIPSGNSGSFNVIITMPEINLRKFATDIGPYGVIDIVWFNGFDKIVLGLLNISNMDDATYNATYANKDITIGCSISLPDITPGMTLSIPIYSVVNSGMFISQDYNKMMLNVYKKFIQDFNDPQQWYTAEVTLSLEGSPVYNEPPQNYIKYSSFKYIMRKEDNDKIGIEILNLWHGFTGGSAEISYQNSITMAWVPVIRISQMEVYDWYLLNGATYFNNLAFTSNHTFDFPSGPMEVRCANVTLMIPPNYSNNKFKISYSRR